MKLVADVSNLSCHGLTSAGQWLTFANDGVGSTDERVQAGRWNVCRMYLCLHHSPIPYIPNLQHRNWTLDVLVQVDHTIMVRSSPSSSISKTGTQANPIENTDLVASTSVVLWNIAVGFPAKPQPWTEQRRMFQETAENVWSITERILSKIGKNLIASKCFLVFTIIQ